ncbi:MAG: hypothetical protein H7263_13155, partial [Candidatus Sericytochromatia bacterium]|nr:hypothetical protein [Candidatus Sericytochromatia bacterium]
SPEATLQLSMVSLIRNTKILAYYLIHDCLDHEGYRFSFQSAIDADGHVTPRYDVLKKVGTFVNEHSNLLCESEEVYSEIGMGVYIPHVRDIIRPNINYWAFVEEMNKALLHFNGLSSIMGALTECGYNPVINDLELMTYEDLKKLKVLFVFSTGHLDKSSYEKILKYVYEGGVLITIGYPVTEYESGEKLTKNVLFPAEPYAASNITNFGTINLASQASYDVISHQITKRQIKHKQSLHTIDMMQPMAEIIKYIGEMGTWIDNERGGKLWASRYVSTWKAGNGITPLLRYSGATVSYSVRHGFGKSIFIGTLLGIFYDSSAYYKKDPTKKESIVNFLSLIFREAGLKPLHTPIPNVEVIIRKAKDSMCIFLVNRGSARDIKLETDFEFYENLEIVFIGKQSIIDKDYFHEHRVLKAHLDTDDVVGINFY